jgi:coenzyme F420-dependent glucose-6-phosphate dehydrogenase
MQKIAEYKISYSARIYNIKESINIVTSIEDCIKSIEEYFKAGFTRVYVHSMSPNEIEFVRTFSKKVLPYFRRNRSR